MFDKKLARFLGLQIVMILLVQTHLCAQKIVVDREAANMSLTEYLQILEKKVNVNFSFASEQIEAQNVKINPGNYELKELLKLILEPLHFHAEFVSDRYVVITSKKTFELTLSVVDKNTLEPLPFATVFDSITAQGYVTDQHGSIILEVPNDSSLHLEVSYLGYQSKKVRPAMVASDYTVKMTSEITTLDEVVITEYLNQGISIDEKSSVIGLNIQDMQILPGLSEPDVLLSAQMMPGITSTDETASGISIRGGTVDQTAFYWNHIPLYSPAHYFGNISAFIPSAIGSVDIYKNFIPVAYGAYTSGLLDITSRSADDKMTSLEANINLTHAELYLHQKLPAELGHLMVAGRRSYNDLLLTPTYTSISEKVFEGSTTELFQTNTREDEFDYNSKINFKDLNMVWTNRLGSKDSVTLSYLYANSLLNFESANEFDITRQQNKAVNQGLGINWQHQWNSSFSSSLNVASSQYSLNYAQDNIRNFPGDFDWFQSRENELKNLEIRLANSKRFNRFVTAGFGYQFNYLQTGFISNTLDIYPDGTEEQFSSEITGDGDVHSLYADMEIQPGERWQINIGARQQLFTFINQSAFDPQIRANHQYNDKLHFKASAGIYHQYLQSFQETDFTISNAAEQLWILAGSTEGRGIVENKQLTLGFLYSNKGWLIDVDGFRKQLTGLNARKVNPILDPFYKAEETIYGLDVLIKKRFKRLRTWASYSFQSSNAKVAELNLTNIPAFSNLRHQLKVVQSYELGSFSFSTSYTYRSGAPYAFADGTREVREDDIVFYQVDYASINEKRLSGYNRVDASLWYYFPKNQQAKLTGSLGLSVINVFDNDNIANRNYAVDDDAEGRIVLTQTDRNLYGFTPNISLRIKIL